MAAVIVVDLGCNTYAEYGEDESIHRLIRRFQPDAFFGFDPHPDTDPGRYEIDGCPVVISRQAAWTQTGQLPFVAASLRSGVESCEHRKPPVNQSETIAVESFDFCSWLLTLPPGELIVKMDVEGAEYELVPALVATGADKMISLLLIEWHGPPLQGLSCPTEEW